MKTCWNCKTEKEFNFFYKRKKSKDGLCGECKECVKKRTADWYNNNKKYCLERNAKYIKTIPEKNKEYQKKYAAKNKAKLYKKSRKWALENKERINELQKQARSRNPEKYKETRNNWIKRNKGKVRQRDAAYKAKKKAGTLSPNQYKQQIEFIYENCPKGHEVDHIIPIVHDLVCGLHVPWNLQYLPIQKNRSKGNKLCLQ